MQYPEYSGYWRKKQPVFTAELPLSLLVGFVTAKGSRALGQARIKGNPWIRPWTHPRAETARLLCDVGLSWPEWKVLSWGGVCGVRQKGHLKQRDNVGEAGRNKCTCLFGEHSNSVQIAAGGLDHALCRRGWGAGKRSLVSCCKSLCEAKIFGP